MKNLPNFSPLLKTAREVAIPDVGEFAISLLIAVIVYGFVSLDHWLSVLSGNNPELKQYSYESIRTALSNISSAPSVDDASVMIVWGAFGAIAYIIVVTILNFFINARNNAMINSTLGNDQQLKAWSLLNEYRRGFWLFLLITLLAFTATTMLPFWLNHFDTFNESYNAMYLLVGTLGLAFNLYLIYSLAAVTWRNPTLTK